MRQLIRVSRAFSLYGCIKGDASEHTQVCIFTGWAGWVTSGPKKKNILHYSSTFPQNTFYLLSSSQVFQWTQNRTSMNHLVNSKTCCQPSTVMITVLLWVSIVIQTASVFFHHRFTFLKSKKKVSTQTHSGDSANYSAWLVLSIIFWVRKEGMSLWICLDWVKLWLLWASVFVSWSWA